LFYADFIDLIPKTMGKGRKRKVDVLVLSDVHLGTYGCHAKELLRYLKTVKPKTVILNGDIVDVWQFSKRYWPKSHMQVVRHLTTWMVKGVKIYYIPGNHDEMLRKFAGFRLGSLRIVNKVVLSLDGEKAWFFHGDVFDVTMQYSKWLARLGAIGYDTLILINRFINFILLKLGRERISLSKRVKNSVKKAVSFINRFEETAAGIAISKGYSYVVCGHIHQPCIRPFSNAEGETTYLNSGDWIENLSALEYSNGGWSIYRYQDDARAQGIELKEDNKAYRKASELFAELWQEFQVKPKPVGTTSLGHEE
jgi:UDP-2,3-diacylglucosamine pyrophosphatase LpxH